MFKIRLSSLWPLVISSTHLLNVSSFSNDLATEGFFPEVQKHLRIIQLMIPLACFHPKMSVVLRSYFGKQVQVVCGGSFDSMNIGIWLHLDPVCSCRAQTLDFIYSTPKNQELYVCAESTKKSKQLNILMGQKHQRKQSFFSCRM